MNAETYTLTPTQQEAKDKFLNWFEDNRGTPNIFRIFGYAGVGKTYMLKSVIQELRNQDYHIISSAFTGKAALIMKRNGLPASTIHSTIYRFLAPDKAAAEQIQKEIDAETDPMVIKDLTTELARAKSMGFELNPESPLQNADLYNLDECSMVNDEMKQDIQSFKIPLLVMGDPGQLPPVKGTGALINEKPDVMLTEILRQALDNPIIKWSMMARRGAKPPFVDLGAAKHVSAKTINAETMMSVDQVLVGKNNSRRTLNQRMRATLGYEGRYPVPGDKLICLRNNKISGLFNGLIATVREKIEEYDTSIKYEIETEDGKVQTVEMLRAHFDEYFEKGTVESLQWWDRSKKDEFDFGYAITVHKAQGSQWDKVLLWDDKFLVWDKAQRPKWLYTGITRAAEELILAS